jgi:hypothetical protein
MVLGDVDRHPNGNGRSIETGSHRRQAPAVCENLQDPLGDGGCPRNDASVRTMDRSTACESPK